MSGMPYPSISEDTYDLLHRAHHFDINSRLPLDWSMDNVHKGYISDMSNGRSSEDAYDLLHHPISRCMDYRPSSGWTNSCEMPERSYRRPWESYRRPWEHGFYTMDMNVGDYHFMHDSYTSECLEHDRHTVTLGEFPKLYSQELCAIDQKYTDFKMIDDEKADDEEENVAEDKKDASDMECVEEDCDSNDLDYSPKSTRRTSRRTTRAPSLQTKSKNRKIAKSAQVKKSKFHCQLCKCVAKDADSLTKHMASAHSRPYVCTFSFAGCTSRFGNKNEWKRHVIGYHLCLQYWLCDVGTCGSGKIHLNCRTFNRKDLFTLHLRRMHAPFSVKRQSRKDAEWEKRISELKVSCLKTRRRPPSKTKCPVRACAQIFEGSERWDNRMEHVGSHLEKKALSVLSSSSRISCLRSHADRDLVEEESDEDFIAWCLKEEIIERRLEGGFGLFGQCGGASE